MANICKASASQLEPTLKKQVDKALDFLQSDSSSRRTLSDFLYNLPRLLANAFTMQHISSGWAVAGLHPFNAEHILSRCTSWTSLTIAQHDALRKSVPALQEHAKAHGEVSDAVMQAQVAQYIDLDLFMEEQTGENKKAGGKPLEQMVLNRRRAVLVSHQRARGNAS